MNIYVTNLNAELGNEELKALFAPHGEVESAEVMMDVFTDLSRGFGYVEMPHQEEAMKAIVQLNQTEVKGRVISVHEAPPKESHKGSYKVGSGAVNVYRFKKN
jgi:RNA recognition motif-containing protein